MKRSDAEKTLKAQHLAGRDLFNKGDIAKLFFNETRKSIDESLMRFVKSGLLKRVCRGLYLKTLPTQMDSHILESIAKKLRSGEYNYTSLETLLSEYSVISQIPIDRLTVMTTGRCGIYHTDYGTIEFTHTKRDARNILQNTRSVKDRPLRMATKAAAIRDLKRVGRNTHLLLED